MNEKQHTKSRNTKISEKKHTMWFRKKTSIGKKEANIVTFICAIVGIVCICMNLTSIAYYKYCFNGVKTEAKIVSVKEDNVSYWDKKNNCQALKTYTNLYVEYDGFSSVFEKENCKITGNEYNGGTVKVAYLPGIQNSVITNFSWGKMVRNIVVVILFIVSIIVAVHERKGYKYNKKHMKIKKVVPKTKEEEIAL